MLILINVCTTFDLFMPNVTYYLTSLCKNRATRILKQRQAVLSIERNGTDLRKGAALDPVWRLLSTTLSIF